MKESVIHDLSPEELKRKRSIKKLADTFSNTGNFDELLKNCRAKLRNGIDPIEISLVITDLLGHIPNESNRLIILHSQSLGINPWENYEGERLGAFTCLLQILDSKPIVKV
jgi:hypothetical protein